MTAEQMQNYRDMVDELLALESGLTAWEIDFLDNLHEWEGEYSPKRVEILQDIYDKRM